MLATCLAKVSCDFALRSHWAQLVAVMRPMFQAMPTQCRKRVFRAVALLVVLPHLVTRAFAPWRLHGSRQPRSWRVARCQAAQDDKDGQPSSSFPFLFCSEFPEDAATRNKCEPNDSISPSMNSTCKGMSFSCKGSSMNSNWNQLQKRDSISN